MQKFKVNGQSVPKIEWKQTDGKTDGGDYITSVANAVGNHGRRFGLTEIAGVDIDGA